MIQQKITSNLWFNNQAEEAANFYISVFNNSRIGRITRYGNEGQEIHGMPEGMVMTVEFEIEGQQFVALNGGPHFQFNEAISFIVNCKTQEEVDYYWKKLSAHPEAEQCGWLKDKFGVSWQIIPTALTELLQDEDEEKVKNVTRAMLQMKKIDINELKASLKASKQE